MTSEPTLEELSGERFRWPTHEDRLLQPADRWSDAEIHSAVPERRYFMTSGYKHAADHLINMALQDRFERNRLIYPILFSYRQFLELSLKGQIEEYGWMADIPTPKRGHDLKALLRAYRKLCLRFHSGSDEALIVVSKCILEFERMDASSFTFRYASQKDGTPYRVSEDRIDLARLKDVMNGVSGFFDGADGYFSDIANAQPAFEGY